MWMENVYMYIIKNKGKEEADSLRLGIWVGE